MTQIPISALQLIRQTQDVKEHKILKDNICVQYFCDPVIDIAEGSDVTRSSSKVS